MYADGVVKQSLIAAKFYGKYLQNTIREYDLANIHQDLNRNSIAHFARLLATDLAYVKANDKYGEEYLVLIIWNAVKKIDIVHEKTFERHGTQ